MSNFLPDPDPTSPTLPTDGGPWSAPRRLALWSAGCFLVLIKLEAVLQLLPATEEVMTRAYAALWDLVVPWVGRVVFGIPDLVYRSTGSSDTTWHYVQLFIVAVLALIVGIVAATPPGRRIDHRAAYGWMIVTLRHVLGLTLFLYGIVKLHGVQFMPTSFADLVTPFGTMSPMGLVWRFMGFSDAYLYFVGGAELLAGLLLLWRRTATLGALVAFAVMLHVTMMNFCFDVPVKLFAAELTLMALFVLSRDAGRLAAFFVLRRAPAAVDPTPEFRGRAARMLHRVGKSCVALVLLLQWHGIRALGQTPRESPLQPLLGLYEVEQVTVAGQERPPLTTDASRWRYLAVERLGYVVAQTMVDERRYFAGELDAAARTLTLSRGLDEPPQVWRFEWSAEDRLVLRAALPEGPSEIRLHRRDPASSVLLARGFRWISEQPFNR